MKKLPASKTAPGIALGNFPKLTKAINAVRPIALKHRVDLDGMLASAVETALEAIESDSTFRGSLQDDHPISVKMLAPDVPVGGAFEQWLRSMPNPMPPSVPLNVTLNLNETEWAMLIQIMVKQSWGVDEAIGEILDIGVLNEFLMCLPDVKLAKERAGRCNITVEALTEKGGAK